MAKNGESIPPPEKSKREQAPKKVKKEQRPAAGVNKHISARVSYLHEAAKYLAKAQNQQGDGVIPIAMTSDGSARATAANFSTLTQTAKNYGEQRRLISHLKGVSMKGKGQARLPQDVKRSFCKRCETLLAEHRTCTTFMENKSREGKKPCADVKVVKCLTCGADKRFPVGSSRQARKGQRVVKEDESQSAQVGFDGNVEAVISAEGGLMQ